MSRLPRKDAKIFGSSATASNIAQFGSLVAGSPAFSTNPNVIQALGNWVGGWYSAVAAGNSPAIEDMNAFCYVTSYLLGYLYQLGMAEWDAGQTYYIGSLVNDGTGKIYKSLTDNNLNNAVSDATNWLLVVGNMATTKSTHINFSTTSATYVDITNATVSVTTHGEEIDIFLQADTSSESFLELNSSANALTLNAYFNVLRDGVSIGTYQMGFSSLGNTQNDLLVPGSSLRFVDAPSAGSHTYKLQAKVIASAGTPTITVRGTFCARRCN